MLPLKGAKIVYLEKEAFASHIKTTRQKISRELYLRIFLNELFLIASNKEPSQLVRGLLLL